ncbi:hypothetical protein WA026_010997 [Henosepilachna vigintioctopunctata]|uniref:Uncharacterized protein n=1 Tax=Henosepilachna vigintioctopunctata TaxID=420089 RepID=A0AAW1UX83_9CUCU
MRGQKKLLERCEEARAKKSSSHENEAIVKTPKTHSEPSGTSYTRWCSLNKQRSCQASEKTIFKKSLMELYCEPVFPDERDDISQYKCEFHSCLKSLIPPVLDKFLQDTIVRQNCPHRKYRLKAPLSTLPQNFERNKTVFSEVRLNEFTRNKCLNSGPQCKIHYRNENSKSEQKNRAGVESCQYITFPKQTSDLMKKNESWKLTRQRRLFHRENQNKLFCRTSSCPYSKYKILNDCLKKQNSSCCSKYYCRNNSDRRPFTKQKIESDENCICFSNLKNLKKKKNGKMSEKASTSGSFQNQNEIDENSIWEMDELNEEGDKNEIVPFDEPTDWERDLEEDENEETVTTQSRETSEGNTHRNTEETSTESYSSQRCSCSLCEIDLYIKKLQALIQTYDPFLSPYSPISDKLQKIKQQKKRRSLSSKKYFKTSRCVCHYTEKVNDEIRKIPFSEMSYIYNERNKADPLTGMKRKMEKWRGKSCERKMIPCDWQFSRRSTKKIEEEDQEKLM